MWGAIRVGLAEGKVEAAPFAIPADRPWESFEKVVCLPGRGWRQALVFSGRRLFFLAEGFPGYPQEKALFCAIGLSFVEGKVQPCPFPVPANGSRE